MRLLLLMAFGALLVACDPLPAKGEGVLRPPDGLPALYRPQHPCVPGQKPEDPDCRQARLADCLGSCKSEFRLNGDMMYLRHCERQCDSELGLDQKGR